LARSGLFTACSLLSGEVIINRKLVGELEEFAVLPVCGRCQSGLSYYLSKNLNEHGGTVFGGGGVNHTAL
jgi:hypothetical protein